MSANRSHLVAEVQKKLRISKAAAERAVNATLDGVKMLVRSRKVLQLIGFGSFKVVDRKARRGRNPKTGEPLRIKASKTVRFTPGKPFKKKL